MGKKKKKQGTQTTRGGEGSLSKPNKFKGASNPLNRPPKKTKFCGNLYTSNLVEDDPPPPISLESDDSSPEHVRDSPTTIEKLIQVPHSTSEAVNPYAIATPAPPVASAPTASDHPNDFLWGDTLLNDDDDTPQRRGGEAPPQPLATELQLQCPVPAEGDAAGAPADFEEGGGLSDQRSSYQVRDHTPPPPPTNTPSPLTHPPHPRIQSNPPITLQPIFPSQSPPHFHPSQSSLLSDQSSPTHNLNLASPIELPSYTSTSLPDNFSTRLTNPSVSPLGLASEPDYWFGPPNDIDPAFLEEMHEALETFERELEVTERGRENERKGVSMRDGERERERERERVRKRGLPKVFHHH